MKDSFQDHGIDVTGKSGQVKLKCPKCSHQRKRENQGKKELSVNIEDGVWKCWHCGWEDFLKDNNKVHIKREKKKYVKPKYQPDQLTSEAISYFGKRGISTETLESFRIGYSKEKREIMFPYLKSGEVVNIKYRDGKKKFRQSPNAERTVYGYDNIDDDCVVFVEGEIDALSVFEAGYKSVVSLPDGSGGYTFWENVEERFKSVRKVVIWTDDDESGYKARNEIAKRVGFEKAVYVENFSGLNDANEVLQKFGPEKVLQLIGSAKDFPIDGIVYAKDVDLMGYWKHGVKEGVSTGLKSIDPFWKFAPEAGELVIATGYPASGKSDFMLDILVKQAKQGRKSGIFSPEEFPLPRLMKKCMEKFYGLNSKDLCEDQVEAAHHWLNENFFFQYLEDSTPNVDMICETIKVLAIKKGIRNYLLDPWGDLDHTIRGSLSETEWVSLALGKLRRVARQYSVTVIVVAHPTKPRPEDLDSDGNAKPPSSWAIAGSAAFRNKADVVLSVHRPLYGDPNEKGEVDINITKVKDKDMGGLGYVSINYDYNSGTYNDIF